jgi:glycosyltransferase involved in cell wall biosynthesis
MRLLMIGHAYVVAENQKKAWALAACPGVDLQVVVPRRWHDPAFATLSASRPQNAPFVLRALPPVGAGREQFYAYLSADLGLRRWTPDVLYVEQGAGAVVYTQSLLYRRLHAPRARAAFFTWWNLPYRARWPLRAIERLNLRASQGAVAGNADAATILRDHGFGGPLLVLPQLGVDPVAFSRREPGSLRDRLGRRRFTVGYVGRLVPEKGVGVLLDAFAAFPVDTQLLVVGPGPMAGAIEAAAAARGWRDRLTLVPGVEHGSVAQYLSCMDILVLPSVTTAAWKEQFGHVLIEAMACEVPVVGSDSGEIPRVIGDAGLVVPEGDAMALRAAVLRLAGSSDLRRHLGAAGRRRVLERYTHEAIARRLVDFLGSL